MAKNCSDENIRRSTTDVIDVVDDTPYSAFDGVVFVSSGCDGPAHARIDCGWCKIKRDTDGPVASVVDDVR